MEKTKKQRSGEPRFEASPGKNLPTDEVVNVYGPSYTRSCRQEDHSPRSALGKSTRPYWKNQVVEHLLRKYKALSSNPSTTKKKKSNNKNACPGEGQTKAKP
jgi:hypothetical protein